MKALFVVSVALLQAFLVQSDDRWHNSPHSLNQIVDKLKEINSSSDNVELFSLGQSTEKRPMYAVKISGKKSENKPVMYMQCLSRGNEWITGTQCLYFADKFSSLYGSDPQITATLDKMDIVILPVMNVDGYAFTRSNRNHRNWRKSRRLVRFSRYNRCYGVDLNRNFGYQWGYVQHSFDPTIEKCHETFRGFGPFSEVETRNVANYLRGLGSNLKGFLDIHDQSRRAFQMPWKYTYTNNPDKNEQQRAAAEASKASSKVGYRLSYYSCCQAAYTGRHGGSSVDWVYGSLKVKYSYEVSVSVRDGYAYSTVAKGLLAGINALAKAICHSGELKLIDTACDETIPKVALVSTLVNQPVLRPHVFCNYTHPFGSSPRFSSGCQHKIWEALKASSAAPGFFEECKLGSDIHQDGGLLTNNPCSIAIHESRLLWPTTPFQCIFSLGTGLYKGRLGSSTPQFSSLREKLLKIVASATDTEAVDTVLRDLLPKSTYYRCNPSLSEDIPMDECRPEMLEQVQIDTKTYLDKNKVLLEKAAQALMKPKTFTQTLQDKWSKWNRWSS